MIHELRCARVKGTHSPACFASTNNTTEEKKTHKKTRARSAMRYLIDIGYMLKTQADLSMHDATDFCILFVSISDSRETHPRVIRIDGDGRNRAFVDDPVADEHPDHKVGQAVARFVPPDVEHVVVHLLVWAFGSISPTYPFLSMTEQQDAGHARTRATISRAAAAPWPPVIRTADADLDGSELAALASFDLPASPVRSPIGSESNMSVWVEATTNGEQRVHLALADASVPSLPDTPPDAHIDATHAVSTAAATLSLRSPFPASVVSSFDTSLSTTTHSSEMLDFPLVLCDSRGGEMDRHSGGKGMSSAIVPFQKLQLDTNLNQTLLPYKSTDATGSSPSGTSSPSRAKTKPFAWEAEATAMMSNDFMHALRLGDLRPQEPQLSVRLRGSRVELASASEEDDVDFMGPAENIKRLFKLPYSQARVSLAVHRVGSTLVVDGELEDSDLPAGFEDFPQETMKIQQQSDETTQNLLYEKFIYESAVQGRLTAHDNDDDSSKASKGDYLPLQQQPSPASPKSSKKSSKKGKKKSANFELKATSVVTHAASEEEHRDDSEAGYTIPPSWIGATEANAPLSDQNRTTTRTATTGQYSGTPAKSRRKKTTTSSASYSPPGRATSSSPESRQSHDPTFQRILKWKFHDLKMVRAISPS